MNRSDELTVAVIGDLVASRDLPDRPATQQALEAALEETNRRVVSLDPLTATVGDEFQGRYATPELALRATLHVQLAMVGAARVRFGVGWGGLRLHDPARAPYGQDGPAWWAAREALEEVEAARRAHGAPGGRATSLSAGEDADRAVRRHVAALRALLVCRDQLVALGDDRDARLTLAVLAGVSVADCAAAEGISPSAASQRLRAGPYAIVAAQRELDAIAASGRR